MIENRDIRAKARDTLEHRLFGNVWIMMIIVALIYGAIVGLPGSIGGLLPGKAKYAIGWIFSIASIIIAGPMEYGLARLVLKVERGDKKIDFKDLFVGFKEDFQNAIFLGFLRDLFIFLWCLLFIIPGIIKAYAYSMAFYIQQDDKDKDWRRCLDLSNEMMRGYKGKLFLLDLSFIGWYIVGLLCLGVGVLWVTPYHTMARAHFYDELKATRKDLFDEPETTVSEDSNADGAVFGFESGEAPAEKEYVELPSETETPSSAEDPEEK